MILTLQNLRIMEVEESGNAFYSTLWDTKNSYVCVEGRSELYMVKLVINTMDVKIVRSGVLAFKYGLTEYPKMSRANI